MLGLGLLVGVGQASPLGRVEIVNSNAGQLMTAHANEYDHKVYVGGLAYRPSSPAIGAHVHVWGLDANNRRVFFRTTSVYFTGKPSLTRTTSFIVSLDPSVFKTATTVYATFHSEADAESRSSK